MELTNEVYSYLNDRKDEDTDYALIRSAAKTILLLLAPFAPFITDELWEMIGYENSIHEMSWPDYKESALEKEEITIVIQVNGKVREKISVDSDISEEEVKEKVLEEEKIQSYLEGNELIKTIYVPGKLVNLVVK
jgi:leucyl-tRNA synthetase